MSSNQKSEKKIIVFEEKINMISNEPDFNEEKIFFDDMKNEEIYNSEEEICSSEEEICSSEEEVCISEEEVCISEEEVFNTKY